MERKLTKLVNNYISQMKKDIKQKMDELNIDQTPKMNALFQYIYDYKKLVITKQDITKRTRARNTVPLCDRCSALRASGEQCTRRRKNEAILCGTHLKGTPHGVIHTDKEIKPTKKITVWLEDLKGIVHYIDENHNVYDPEDIRHNIQNPKIVAKWKKNEAGEYIIPEFI